MEKSFEVLKRRNIPPVFVLTAIENVLKEPQTGNALIDVIAGIMAHSPEARVLLDLSKARCVDPDFFTQYIVDANNMLGGKFGLVGVPGEIKKDMERCGFNRMVSSYQGGVEDAVLLISHAPALPGVDAVQFRQSKEPPFRDWAF